MRSLYTCFLITIVSCLSAQADESAVFTCRFENDPHGFSSIRMKKFFDMVENQELGKVDLIQNFIVVESTPTRVFQIPLPDNQTYMQIWHSPTIRVDAQLTYTQGTHEFRAIYNKKSEKIQLICIELRN